MKKLLIKKLFFLLIFLYFNNNLLAQNQEERSLIKNLALEDIYTSKEAKLNGKVQSLQMYVSEVFDKVNPLKYKKNKWFNLVYKFNTDGNIIFKGMFEGPVYFPPKYFRRDSLLYSKSGKIKEIRKASFDDEKKALIYFDSNGNEVKFISFTGKTPDEDEYKSITKKSYKYNSFNKILEEKEFSNNDTLKKNLSKRNIYKYDKNQNLIELTEYSLLFNMVITYNTPYIVTKFTYNSENKVIQQTFSTAKKILYTIKNEYDKSGEKTKAVNISDNSVDIVLYKNNLMIEKIIQSKRTGKAEKINVTYEFDSKKNWTKFNYKSNLEPGKNMLIEREILYYE